MPDLDQISQNLVAVASGDMVALTRATAEFARSIGQLPPKVYDDQDTRRTERASPRSDRAPNQQQQDQRQSGR